MTTVQTDELKQHLNKVLEQLKTERDGITIVDNDGRPLAQLTRPSLLPKAVLERRRNPPAKMTHQEAAAKLRKLSQENKGRFKSTEEVVKFVNECKEDGRENFYGN